MEKFNRRTKEYKEEQKAQKIERQKKAEYLKFFSSYFAFEGMIGLLRNTAEMGLKMKRDQFLISMKVRLIQHKYRKYRILKKINQMRPELRKRMITMIKNYRAARRVRKLVLWHLKAKMKLKIKTAVFLLRVKLAK